MKSLTKLKITNNIIELHHLINSNNSFNPNFLKKFMSMVRGRNINHHIMVILEDDSPPSRIFEKLITIEFLKYLQESTTIEFNNFKANLKLIDGGEVSDLIDELVSDFRILSNSRITDGILKEFFVKEYKSPLDLLDSLEVEFLMHDLLLRNSHYRVKHYLDGTYYTLHRPALLKFFHDSKDLNNAILMSKLYFEKVYAYPWVDDFMGHCEKCKTEVIALHGRYENGDKIVPIDILSDLEDYL